MKAVWQLLAVCLIAGACAAATYAIKGAPVRTVICDPADLKPDEICLAQVPAGDGILWVDARKRADWQKNGLPGSILWSLEPGEDMQAFEVDVAAHVVQTPRVIVYCGDENCGLSREVAKRIGALGLGAEVSVLHGGWRALSEAGRIPAGR